MKSHRSMTEREAGGRKPPPKVITWIPPHGAVVEHGNLHEARLHATAFAGERPGRYVGVYELVGVAFVPITYPDVDPVERESSALMLAAPEGGGA